MQWRSGEVIENIRWNDRLCSLKIAVQQPVFEAGQFVRLGLPAAGGDAEAIEARPYSFVNAPDEALLEVYFNRVPEGSFSNRLFSLQPGQTVKVADRAAGFMVMSEVPAGKHLWLLATGTALGPFLSILKTPVPWQQFEKVVLVHSVRSADELTYTDTLQTLKQRYGEQLVWLNAVTRKPVAGAMRQRIPEAISSGELETQAGLTLTAEDSRVMLCGNPEMVTAALRALQVKGLSKHLRRAPGQVLQEEYK